MVKRAKKVGIIYTVRNQITGEFYVGATTNGLNQRKLDHEERTKRGEPNKFHDAIATYGTEAFKWEQIDTANSIDELANKEKEYVIQYDSKENGYNSDSGGGIKKTVYQYNTDGKLINTYDSLESAANAVRACKKSISNTCLGQNKTCKGYYWSNSLMVPYLLMKDKRMKKVLQMDLNGIKIAEYRSVAEASRKTGMSKTCIARVCRGERKQSGEFFWKYIIN